MLTPEVAEVGPLLIIRSMRAKSLRHGQNERAVAHVEPEAPPHELAIGVPGERTIVVLTEIWHVELVAHYGLPHETWAGRWR